jgi:hypothetical protein
LYSIVHDRRRRQLGALIKRISVIGAEEREMNKRDITEFEQMLNESSTLCDRNGIAHTIIGMRKITKPSE